MENEQSTSVFESRLPPQAITAIDGFLNPPIPQEELERIANLRDPNRPGRYLWSYKDDLAGVSRELKRFYDRVVYVAGLNEKQIVGVEYWVNLFDVGDGIHMHSDIDETLYKKTRRLECAIAGAMAYGECPGITGGSMVFEDGVSIRPRRNRCVIFFGGTRHGVEIIKTGTRSSVLMAFWHRVPEAYTKLKAEDSSERSEPEEGSVV